MSLLLRFAGLALRQVVKGALYAVGLEEGVAAIDPVNRFLTGMFSTESDRLQEALRKAHQQAWQALEVSLSGEGLWDRLGRQFITTEVKSFRSRVLALLQGLSAGERVGLSVEEFRDRSRTDLQRARQAGLTTGGFLQPDALARETGQFAGFVSTEELVAAEWRSIEAIGRYFQAEEYPYLSRFLLLREDGWPLLALAARYFLSKHLESDEKLFQRLMLQREGGLTAAQRQMLGEMQNLLVANGAKLNALLDLGTRTHRNTEQLIEDNRRIVEQLNEVLRRLEQLQSRPMERPVEVKPEEPTEPEPVPALAEGEPPPEVPPRYPPVAAETECVQSPPTQSLPLNASLWTATTTAAANPGAALSGAQERPPRTLVGGAFQTEAAPASDDAPSVEAEEPTTEGQEDPPRGRGLPPLFDT